MSGSGTPEALMAKVDRACASARALLDRLGKLLGNDEMLALQKVQLHYLGGGVEAEVFVGAAVIRDPQRLARLKRVLTEHIGNDPYFRCISINCTIAP